MKTCNTDTFLFTVYFDFNPTIFTNWLIKLRDLVSFRVIWIEIVLRSNFVSVAISQFNAIAAFIAKLTASLFKVGSTPGYPKSITLVCVFGSAPNSVGLAEKIFEFVLTQREPLNQ